MKYSSKWKLLSITIGFVIVLLALLRASSGEEDAGGAVSNNSIVVRSATGKALAAIQVFEEARATGVLLRSVSNDGWQVRIDAGSDGNATLKLQHRGQESIVLRVVGDKMVSVSLKEQTLSAEIRAEPAAGVDLVLEDGSSGQRLQARVGGTESAGIVVSNREGRGSIGMRQSTSGKSALEFLDNHARRRMVLGLDESGRPRLEMFNEAGESVWKAPQGE